MAATTTELPDEWREAVADLFAHVPLSSADITTRAHTAGIDLTADIADAEALRAAEVAAGAW